MQILSLHHQKPTLGGTPKSAFLLCTLSGSNEVVPMQQGRERPFSYAFL